MVKRKKLGKKLGKKIKKTLKNFGSSKLLKSSVTLYFVLLVSIGLVLMYLSKKDYNSLMVLIAVGLLTNYFTKNMTITLGVAIIVSLIVRMKISQKEGFKEGESVNDKLSAKDKVDVSSKRTDKFKKDLKEDRANPKKCFEWNGDKDKWDRREDRDGAKGKKCTDPEKPDEWCFKSKEGDCTRPAKDGFSKRLIPSSEPAKVGNDEEDEVDIDRIDYAKTLEQAYDNLQGMLGKDGISGLTSETSKLVEQQAGLMESLKGMGPMLKEAKTMMSGMKDMGGMETMKDMKSIINSIGGKKL
jgi:hypothetical protein